MVKEKWHQEKLRVHYKDTDQMGVAHHANYVSWFEIGRTEWMRKEGLAYRRMEELDLLLPVVQMEAKYERPARYDDCLAIFTKVTKVTAIRLQFEYEVRKINEAAGSEKDMQEQDDMMPYGERLTTGSTLHTWVTSNWKPARIDKVAPSVYAILQQ